MRGGNGNGGEVLRYVHTLFNVGTMAGLSDGELLERFTNRDGEVAELAFAVLVERHGPMVLRICQRVLGNNHDAQDAFQATFLVLVRRTGSIRKQGSVGSWLYGVACRVAADARASAAKRRMREHALAEEAVGLAPDDDLERKDLGTLLRCELERLPERYRGPIVLCYLEGLTHEEAALRLGRPVTTVRTCLARGKDRLRGRLARRGIVPAAGTIAAALARDARAAVPVPLVESTVKVALQFAAGRATAGVVPVSVAALTQGVLRTMLMTKLKFAAAVLTALTTAGTGAGVLAYQDAPAPVVEGRTETLRPTELPAADVTANTPRPENALSDVASTPSDLPAAESSAAVADVVPAGAAESNPAVRHTITTRPIVKTYTVTRPVKSVEDRVAAVPAYLEKTKKEVDVAVSDLRTEIQSLQTRLEHAKQNLRRMEALQAALVEKNEKVGFNVNFHYEYPGQPGQQNKQNGMKAGSSSNAPQGAQQGNKQNNPNSNQAQPNGVNSQAAQGNQQGQPGSNSAQSSNPQGQSGAPSLEEQRNALDREIERLTRERNRIGGRR